MKYEYISKKLLNNIYNKKIGIHLLNEYVEVLYFNDSFFEISNDFENKIKEKNNLIKEELKTNILSHKNLFETKLQQIGGKKYIKKQFGTKKRIGNKHYQEEILKKFIDIISISFILIEDNYGNKQYKCYVSSEYHDAEPIGLVSGNKLGDDFTNKINKTIDFYLTEYLIEL